MALNFLNNGYFAGKVGIGVEGPGAVLGVRNPTAGSSTLSLQHSTSSSIFDFQTGIANVTGNALVIKDVANSYNYLTLRDDNVGIGTINPNSKLEVFKSGGTVFNVLGSLGQLFSVTDNLSGEIFAVADISGVPIMSINSSGVSYFDGKVGIGTHNPVSSLNITTTKTVALDTAAKFLTLGLTVDDLTAGNTAGGGGGIAFRSKNTIAGTQIVFGAIDAIKESANVSDFKGSLRFFTNQNSTGIPLARMRIDSAGNVGIGQDVPINSLDVYRATGDASIRIQAETASDSTILKFRNQNSDADITVDQTTSNRSRMVFTTDNTSGYVPVLSLEANRDTLIYGNLGINDTSPDFRLDVGGTFGVSDLPFNSTSVSVLVTNETTGAELVTNGSFANGATDWGGNFSIANGVATYDATSQKNLFQSETLTSGLTYKLKFTISNSTLGGARIWFGNSAGAINYFGGTYIYYADGTYESLFTMPSTQTNFCFFALGTGSPTPGAFDITGISIKQIISASDQIQKREISSDVFTGGPFLPLVGGSLSGPGNLTVGGTLTVTGNSTLNGDLYLGTDADILKSGTNPFRLFTNGTLALSVSSSQTATFAGKVITTEVESTSTLLLDATDDITIDAGGGDIILSDDEVIFGTISSTGGMQIRSRVDDADMFLRGVNNGAEFDALTLDMSEGGDATFAGLITANKPQNATSNFAFQNLDTTGTSVRTHLTATAGNRSIRLEAIHSDYSYVASNNARMYLQTNDGSNNTLLLDGDNATFAGTVSGTTATFTTFSGDLNGTINTATTAFTQANGVDNTTVATTAYVVNKIAELPAGLNFLGTWNADMDNGGVDNKPNGDPALLSGGGERSEGTTTTLTANKLIDSSATFTASPAVAVGDRVRVVTPNGPEFALVTAVDSATQLTLAADIVTATGEAYILEVAPFLTEGSYYIVSAENADSTRNATLNGIQDWKVGDWAVASSTNVWQKIDNSSVLDGSGTGGSVAGWAGSGTSNTLTDAPITFSGNNSTFAGEITTTELNLPSSGKIDWANGDARIIEGEVGGYSLSFEVYNGVAALERVLLLEKSMRATFAGDIFIKSAALSNQENTTVDIGTEVVAEVSTADFTAAFFDFVIKKGINVRSGTVYACHNGASPTPLIQFTETSTQDLGDTSDVVLSVGFGGGAMQLKATVTSNGWSIKSLIRGI